MGLIWDIFWFQNLKKFEEKIKKYDWAPLTHGDFAQVHLIQKLPYNIIID